MKVFILDSKSGKFLIGEDRQDAHHLVWHHAIEALSPYGCGVFVSFAKGLYQSLELDETNGSTLFYIKVSAMGLAVSIIQL